MRLVCCAGGPPSIAAANNTNTQANQPTTIPTGSAWFETAVSRPELVLKDFIKVIHPQLDAVKDYQVRLHSFVSFSRVYPTMYMYMYVYMADRDASVERPRRRKSCIITTTGRLDLPTHRTPTNPTKPPNQTTFLRDLFAGEQKVVLTPEDCKAPYPICDLSLESYPDAPICPPSSFKARFGCMFLWVCWGYIDLRVCVRDGMGGLAPAAHAHLTYYLTESCSYLI